MLPAAPPAAGTTVGAVLAAAWPSAVPEDRALVEPQADGDARPRNRPTPTTATAAKAHPAKASTT